MTRTGLATVTVMGVVVLGVACSSETTTWKEEVLMHDGTKVIVTRTRIFGGPREVGQNPVATWTFQFSPPDKPQERITLEVPGGVAPLILDKDDTGAFVFAGSPVRGDAYNYYGCPQPPYVFFRYKSGTWERIDLTAFPAYLVKRNLLGSLDEEFLRPAAKTFISAERIAEINQSDGASNFLKTIKRERVPGFWCFNKK